MTTTQDASVGAPPKRPAGNRSPGAPEVPRWRRRLRPYLLSVPAVALIIGILLPFIRGIQFTFYNYSATRPNPALVGFNNYISVLTDSKFWHSVLFTVEFAVLATGIETILGVALALLLNRSTLIGKVLEKVLILPLMIAPVIAGVIWKLMFNSTFGVLNYVFGLGGTYDFLSREHALASIILVDAWTFTPFVAILVLAGIRSLPKEPFEASDVDGASWFYMFRRLMLPMIWPYILVAVIFRFMDNLKIFDVIQVLTNGGPGDTTRSLQVGAYLDSITKFDYSRGSTYMFLLWIIVYIAAYQLVKVLSKAQARAAGSDV
ncbi:MAG TPA: sugar ABC transporter permease [Propionibacteriaceae bacterium]|nr:sugar ABC transporter permease [Propionibacteriaceae bacterium]